MSYTNNPDSTTGHHLTHIDSDDIKGEKYGGVNVHTGSDSVMDAEKHGYVTDPDEFETEHTTTHRNLKARHVSMIAIGGAVGSGLIIGSGSALSKAGPVGLLIGYSLVGLICFTVMTALGEVSSRKNQTWLAWRIDYSDHLSFRRWLHGYRTSVVSPVMREFSFLILRIIWPHSDALMYHTAPASSTTLWVSQPDGITWPNTCLSPLIKLVRSVVFSVCICSSDSSCAFLSYQLLLSSSFNSGIRKRKLTPPYGGKFASFEVLPSLVLMSYYSITSSSIIIVVIVAINILGVAFFGEIEFWMSTCKVLVLVGLLLLGIILDLGGGPTHDRIGFRYWKSKSSEMRFYSYGT